MVVAIFIIITFITALMAVSFANGLFAFENINAKNMENRQVFKRLKWKYI